MEKKQSATQRLRGLVFKEISRLESKGFIVPEALKERLGKATYKTLESYRGKGKVGSYKRLLSEVQAVDVETGEVITARRARKKTREAGVEKARQTREHRKMSKAERGKMIYENILERINAHDNGKWWYGGKHLRELLQEQINEFGFERVMGAIANANETKIMELTDKAIQYDSTSIQHHEAITALENIITSEALTPEELAKRARDENEDEDGEPYTE